MEQKIGHYSFIGGVIIAVVLGLTSLYNLGDQANTWLASLLVVLGLIAGFLNVSTKESKDFLLVATVLVISVGVGKADAVLGEVEAIGQILEGIFSNVLAFVVPATVVVGLKQIWNMGQNN